jgi:hypothetical protein
VAAGLSQKIWQKIMILQSSAPLQSAAHCVQPLPAAAPSPAPIVT